MSVDPRFAQKTWADWETLLARWSKTYPVEVRTLGKTRQGRKIPLVRLHSPITGGQGADKGGSEIPELMILTGIHPREQSPPLVVSAFLEELLAQKSPWLARRTIWWVPTLNLDGKLADEAGGPRGKDVRKNAAGVDLNRNFLVRWGGGRQYDAAWSGSTDDPKTNIYEGPAPLSEPETQALARFWASRKNLRGFLDVHNPLREILCPPHAIPTEHARLTRVLEAMQRSQKDAYKITDSLPGAEPKPGTRAGNSGLTYAHAYYLHGIYGYNFELSTPDKDRGRAGRYPGAEELETEYERNIRGALEAFVERAGELPAASEGRIRVRGAGKLDGEVRPCQSFGWTPPPLDGPCAYAVLTCASPELVVTSEYRNVPVTTPFTLEVSKAARPGQKIPLALTLWDDQKRRTIYRFTLMIS